MKKRTQALLLTSDGRVFSGYSYGAPGTVRGSHLLATQVTGYQQLLSAPENHGKILVFTSPHIGNTGITHESLYSVAGVVVRDPAIRPSHHTSRGDLEESLAKAGIIGICDIDTRALTHHLRNHPHIDLAIVSDAHLSHHLWENEDADRALLIKEIF